MTETRIEANEIETRKPIEKKFIKLRAISLKTKTNKPLPRKERQDSNK